MARPKKTGLDYFPFDVDFFHDRKIRALKGKYGSDGILAYQYILCEIYRDKGYYTELDEEFILCMSDDLNIKENSTRQILKYLLSRSLLYEIKDSTLAKSVTIITAKSIQKRFQEIKKYLKRDVTVETKYWILEKSETNPFIKVCSENDFSENNPSFSEKNSDKSRKNTIKESKGKESKIKESRGESKSACADTLPHGRYKNVYLTDDELQALKNEFPNDYAARIERLSEYIASSGKKYKSHLATIRSWAKKDKEKSQSDTDRKSSFDIDDLQGLSMFND